MELKNKLIIKNKPILERYLKKAPHSLSCYAFQNIYIWKPHFDIFTRTVCGNLCVFFKDRIGCFMILPPLPCADARTTAACFDIMESINANTDISRIENIEERDLKFFPKKSFRIFEKSKDYILDAFEAAELKGEKFRHKRPLINFFKKNNKYEVRGYVNKDKAGVVRLYNDWMAERKAHNNDLIYQAMLNDSRKAFIAMLKDFGKLNMSAYIVKCDGKIRAFTSGFELSKGLFCINFEIADLSYKGLAQFIFNEFAKELAPRYPEINIMDDSGIENIRKTKLSYRPVRIVPSYTALLNV